MSRLTLEDLRFRYDPQGPAIIAGVNLEVKAGENCLILGDNGSGKTTFGKLLAGMAQPESGAVFVDGRPIHKFRVAERPRHGVYLGQTSYLQFFRASIAEELGLACKLAGTAENRAETAYGAFNLPADRTAKPMDLAYPEMWRFQLLLLAVIFSPTVLFIDEVVAPGSSVQRRALDYVLQLRSAAGQVTLIAYQRALCWFSHREFLLRDGKMSEV